MMIIPWIIVTLRSPFVSSSSFEVKHHPFSQPWPQTGPRTSAQKFMRWPGGWALKMQKICLATRLKDKELQIFDAVEFWRVWHGLSCLSDFWKDQQLCINMISYFLYIHIKDIKIMLFSTPITWVFGNFGCLYLGTFRGIGTWYEVNELQEITCQDEVMTNASRWSKKCMGRMGRTSLVQWNEWDEMERWRNKSVE